jgi:hypothetical protein
MLNRLALNFPSGKPELKLYCPSCGVLVVNDEDEVEQPACEHVLFLYLDDIAEFLYIEPELERLIEAKRKNEDEDESDYELLLKEHPSSSTAFVWEETTSGFACGPVSSTLAVGFDLARTKGNT